MSSFLAITNFMLGYKNENFILTQLCPDTISFPVNPFTFSAGYIFFIFLTEFFFLLTISPHFDSHALGRSLLHLVRSFKKCNYSRFGTNLACDVPAELAILLYN